jgi:glucose/arabinose dehydrogenase
MFFIRIFFFFLLVSGCGGGSDGGGPSVPLPVIVSGDPFVIENSTQVDGIEIISADMISIGGADADLFEFQNGGLQLISPVDFEKPMDDNGDNVFSILVSASNEAGSITSSLSIFVRNLEEFFVGPYHPLLESEFDYRLHDRVSETSFGVETIMVSEEPLWGLSNIGDEFLVFSSSNGSIGVLDIESMETFSFDASVEIDLSRGDQKGSFGIDSIQIDSGYRIFFAAAEALDDGHRLSLFSVDFETVPTPSFVNLQRHFSDITMPLEGHYGGAVLIDNNEVLLSGGDRRDRYSVQGDGSYTGNIFRFMIDPSGDLIPHPENVFSSRPEVFTRGHRNVQGMTIVPFTGGIVAAEHGPQGGDELNLLSAGTNYGWPLATFGEEYGGGIIGETTLEGFEDGLTFYTPSIAPREIIYITENKQFPFLSNAFLIASLKFGLVSVVKFNSSRPSMSFLELGPIRVSGLTEMPNGNIYVSTNNSPSEILRIIKVD